MKAYISVVPLIINGAPVCYAEVISEDDYHNRGAHARSHRTSNFRTRETAESHAKHWAETNGFEVVSVDGIA